MRQESVNPTAVPSFDSVDELVLGMKNRDNYREQSLYPRYGNVSLAEAEEAASEFARVEPDELLLYTSGMAALTSALEVSLGDRLAKGATLACTPALYSQTSEYIQNTLQDRGVKVVYFDPQNKDSIDIRLFNSQPDVILAETVGNSPRVPVIDTEYLMKVGNSLESNPIVVLDNTLPLSTGLPLGEQIKADDKVVVVESGTKAYTANTEMSGMLYSKNHDILKDAKALRCSSGNLPGVASLNRICELLPSNIGQFDDRNMRLYENAASLAMYLTIAQDEGAPFKVNHPGIKSHPDHAYSSYFLHRGTSPVLFLEVDYDYSNQIDITRKLWDSEEVRENAELGQSFGFDTARILPDLESPAIRIASGANTDVHALGMALVRASMKIKKDS